MTEDTRFQKAALKIGKPRMYRQSIIMPRPKPETKPDSFRLRVSPELHQRLKEAAVASGRPSMNAEIIYRLEQTFDPMIAAHIIQLEEDRRQAFLEETKKDPAVLRQIDALIDKAMKSKEFAVVVERVKRNPADPTGPLLITRQERRLPRKQGERPMVDEPDKPDDEMPMPERPSRGVKVRKLTEEERKARARALDELKAANQHRKAE